jgi:hypothetical protein
VLTDRTNAGQCVQKLRECYKRFVFSSKKDDRISYQVGYDQFCSVTESPDVDREVFLAVCRLTQGQGATTLDFREWIVGAVSSIEKVKTVDRVKFAFMILDDQKKGVFVPKTFSIFRYAP